MYFFDPQSTHFGFCEFAFRLFSVWDLSLGGTEFRRNIGVNVFVLDVVATSFANYTSLFSAYKGFFIYIPCEYTF